MSLSNPQPEPALHVVLVEPEIPWNTGNIGRTCLATGAQLHLVRPLGFSLAEHQVRRAGLDYWRHVELRMWSSLDELVEHLPELGEPYLFSAEGTQSLWQPSFPRRTVLILGSESRGLPTSLRQRFADRMLSIPMVEGPVRSLNLSTSAALAIYEVRRQQARE